MATTEDKYPECTKMDQVSDESQRIGEFIEWLQEKGYILARYEEVEGYSNPQLIPSPAPIERLLADYFGIDLDKVDQEQREILKVIRAANDAIDTITKEKSS